jgi:quercetin dioxygenase-like cupin family protein
MAVIGNLRKICVMRTPVGLLVLPGNGEFDFGMRAHRFRKRQKNSKHSHNNDAD